MVNDNQWISRILVTYLPPLLPQNIDRRRSFFCAVCRMLFLRCLLFLVLQGASDARVARTLGLRLGLDMTAGVTSMGVVFGVSVYQRASD
jgi:hypothetical protein